MYLDFSVEDVNYLCMSKTCSVKANIPIAERNLPNYD
jgi:hypothetical protein